MKKILSGDITSTAEQPFKQGTWIHLQEGISESLAALARQIIGASTYDPTTVYILFGCVNSTVPPIYTVSAGFVFYNDEIYAVPTFTFTAVDAAVGAIDVSYFVGANADPVQFTDGINHNVHAIRRITVTDTPSVGNLDFDNWLRAGVEDQIQVGVTPGAPAFQNSWSSAIGGLFFRRNAATKTVTVHGLATKTPIPVFPAAGTIIFTLPVGYRPTLADTGYLTVVDGLGDICSVVINSSGQVSCGKYAASSTGVSSIGLFATFYIG